MKQVPDERPASSATLELYKLAVEMADRVSARRSSANAFFLTVQTAFVAVLGLAAPKIDALPWWASLAVVAAGLALSCSWWLQLKSYRDLNRAKFAVIGTIEDQLPVRIYKDEWALLRADSVSIRRTRYQGLGVLERVVPIVFGCIYILLYVGRLGS